MRTCKTCEGTRQGRQELLAELLEDVEGALWTRGLIEQSRVRKVPKEFKTVIVGVDPSASASETSDEAGIVVEGKGWCTCKAAKGGEHHYFTLADRSLRGAPARWAAAAVRAYHEFKANYIVAEANNGGEMVREVIKHADPSVAVKIVHASRGKQTRAEPVSMLYEQGKCHHVGAYPALEDEMCTWVPGDDSPNRMDALVWAFSGFAKTIGYA